MSTCTLTGSRQIKRNTLSSNMLVPVCMDIYMYASSIVHSVGWANLDTFRQSRQHSSALGVGTQQNWYIVDVNPCILLFLNKSTRHDKSPDLCRECSSRQFVVPLSPWAFQLYSKMSRKEQQKLKEKQEKRSIKMVKKSLKRDGTTNASSSQLLFIDHRPNKTDYDFDSCLAFLGLGQRILNGLLHILESMVLQLQNIIQPMLKPDSEIRRKRSIVSPEYNFDLIYAIEKKHDVHY